MDRQEPPKTPPVSPKPPTWTAPPPLQIPPQMSRERAAACTAAQKGQGI